jgi:hypothetical protein
MNEDDLLQMIADEINAIQILQPGDVTITRLTARTGRRQGMVAKYLTAKVESGELVIVKKYDPKNSRNVNVYERPKIQ